MNSCKGPVKVEAWIQMGCERREVTFEVTREEVRAFAARRDFHLALELYIEDAVQAWISCRFGWGWRSQLGENDCSFMEENPDGQLCIVEEELNPRTRRSLVVPILQRTQSDSGRGARNPMKLANASRPHGA